jgi:aryl-alcohol dehydrogenase-like predicted oxidoreductase
MSTKAQELFGPCPEPATELGRYRILASTAGVRVSPLCLGAMSLGTAWSSLMGSADEEQSFKILDSFAESGGNFIDTANAYQDEQSETYLGNWMAARKNRYFRFVETKFTNNYRHWELGGGRTVNFSGNSKKSLHVSVQDSLKKLQTSYIDLLYVHWWDWTTSIEELMDSLHILVNQGKVLYLGISDAPAWVVSAANVYAQSRGKTQFSVYQGRWNVMSRDFERDIIPMARHFGMALCPWNVLAGGKLQTTKQIEARTAIGETLRVFSGTQQTDEQRKTSYALEKIAAEKGPDVSIQQVALAYVMQKTTNVFPIVGCRKVEQLADNIKALSVHLTDDDIASLESISQFDAGFPHTMIEEDPRLTGKTSGISQAHAQISWQRLPKPLGRA